MVFDFKNSPSSSISISNSGKNTSSNVDQFLRFILSPDTNVMLPISQVTEALKIPSHRIIPIPHMPPWVMGVYNWRGEILWMIDLGHLVGLTPRHQQLASFSTHRAIVIHSGSKGGKSSQNRGETIGLIVTQVEDIEWCNVDEIYSPPNSSVTPELAPFLRGYWLNPNDDNMVITIDGDAIMAAMPKP